MRILQTNNPEDIEREMRQIGVDPYGIKIMLPKADSYIIKINSLPCIEANILKQEMLSLGGDVAVAKNTLTGKIKKTDCLIMGNNSQYSRLRKKLANQPFGLKNLAGELSGIIGNYQKDKFMLRLGRQNLNISAGKTYIMGIVNLTPDSFSGDGLYRRQATENKEAIVNYVQQMISDGADIIDIGGESTRPGANPVSVKEELSRIIPVINLLAKKIKAPISVDTYKPEVANAALDCGVSLVNDITGLRDSKMLKVVRKHNAAVVVMHSKGSPKTMQNKPEYFSLMDEVILYLKTAVNRALEAGVVMDKIIIDPGIGFGKTVEHNLALLKNLREFKIIGRPILAGISRKSFIGKILHTRPKERLSGTLASCVLTVKNGASILRVHDVKAVKEAIKVVDAVARV